MALWTNAARTEVHDDMGGEALSLSSWPQGMVQITQAEADAILNPPKTATQIQSELEATVQSYMDAQAQLKGYDNIVSACSYAAAPNAFQAEGISFLNWRAACWSYCYTLLAQVNAGTVAVPTAAQLIAGLPVRV